MEHIATVIPQWWEWKKRQWEQQVGGEPEQTDPGEPATQGE